VLKRTVAQPRKALAELLQVADLVVEASGEAQLVAKAPVLTCLIERLQLGKCLCQIVVGP